MSCKSDGDISEELDELAVKAYNFNKVKFFKRIYSFNLSCLKGSFVRGMSVTASVYQGRERHAYMQSVYRNAETAYGSLTPSEVAASKKLVNQINPSRFD
jgi:hypothetical protein